MRYLEGTNILCLEYAEYVRDNIVSPELFRQQRHRKDIVAHGNGEKALIEYETIPHKYRAKVRAKYGDPYEYASREPLRKLITEDMDARKFYAEQYLLPTGERLDIEVQRDYSRQCDYLNLITLFLKDKKAFKRLLNTSTASIWQNIIQIAKADRIKHSLPGSQKRILVKHKKYTDIGYSALVEEWRYGNNHARLVTEKIEDLLMAIYLKRYGRATQTQVVKDYNAFIMGRLELVDTDTGELFDQNDFLVKGQLYELSPATVNYYANLKHNRERIDLIKLDRMTYIQKHKPHNRRIPAQYAFSKISMDDYLPPFKTLDGKREVWMYAIFDCASKAIVGVAYGRDKNKELVNEALKDMFRLCVRKGWGIPAEIEMEKSLNWGRRGSKEQPDIFTSGEAFPFTRFESDNPQGKNAEGYLRLFKYQQLADDEGFLGRPFGRNENYKLNRDKKEARYMVQELESRLKKYVYKWNHSPISEDDETTRWQYLCENQHPDVVKHPRENLMPYIGFKTKTSIHRRVAQVQNDWYEVPNNLTWKRDIKGRVNVEAYWIPEEDQGAPDQVYIYQNGKFLCEAKRQDRYHDAQIERTAEDWRIFGRQTARQEDFEIGAKEGLSRIPRVDTISRDRLKDMQGIEHVRVGYNKLAQEEEAYAELNGFESPKDAENPPEKPRKMHKKAPKQGGYVQKFDPENIVTNAISSL